MQKFGWERQPSALADVLRGIRAQALVNLVRCGSRTPRNVAIVGVTLAALSIGWQAATFVLSGSRVKVNLRRGGVRRDPG